MDPFWFTARMVQADPDDSTPADSVAATLERAALDYLTAGGQVTQPMWDTFTDTTRAAFVKAGEFLRREQAALIAEAITGGPARVMAPVDGGHAWALEVLREGVADAKREARGVPFPRAG